MRTLQDCKREADQLAREAQVIFAAKQDLKAKNLIFNLKQNADQLAHSVKAKPYLDFLESEAYVKNLQSEIEKSGTIAHSPLSGTAASIKWHSTAQEFQTFTQFKSGQTLEIESQTYICTAVTGDAAGYTVKTLRLNSVFKTENEPYGVPCAFDGKIVITPKDTPLEANEIIVISGVKYTPVSRFIEAAYHKYEVQSV